MSEPQKISKKDKKSLIRGIIYKIYSPYNSDMIYIGSTTSSLKDRLLGHKRSYRRWNRLKKGYLASFKIFDKYKVDNVVIEKIDKLYFDKNEKCKLLRLEGVWQRKINCVNIVTNNDMEIIPWGKNVWKCKNEDNNETFSMKENPFKDFMYKAS